MPENTNGVKILNYSPESIRNKYILDIARRNFSPEFPNIAINRLVDYVHEPRGVALGESLADMLNSLHVLLSESASVYVIDAMEQKAQEEAKQVSEIKGSSIDMSGSMVEQMHALRKSESDADLKEIAGELLARGEVSGAQETVVEKIRSMLPKHSIDQEELLDGMSRLADDFKAEAIARGFGEYLPSSLDSIISRQNEGLAAYRQISESQNFVAKQIQAVLIQKGNLSAEEAIERYILMTPESHYTVNGAENLFLEERKAAILAEQARASARAGGHLSVVPSRPDNKVAGDGLKQDGPTRDPNETGIDILLE